MHRSDSPELVHCRPVVPQLLHVLLHI